MCRLHYSGSIWKEVKINVPLIPTKFILTYKLILPKSILINFIFQVRICSRSCRKDFGAVSWCFKYFSSGKIALDCENPQRCAFYTICHYDATVYAFYMLSLPIRKFNESDFTKFDLWTGQREVIFHSPYKLTTLIRFVFSKLFLFR